MLPATSERLPELLLLLLCMLAGICQLVPSASAIQCYQCNSVREEGCDDLSKGTSYLKDCPDDGKGTEFFCRKMVQTVQEVSNTRVIRSCGWEKSPHACYRYDDDDHSEVVCQCFEDGCNSAPGRRAALLSPALLPALLLARP
ncbi:uncharacterized protein LOC134542925 [Bacillus rossius redtenbacheri]|uniref:uncharacterized protein LOC134542925 n=1 Tax=Bacillus rossius redtenbacheri TaxID=93214 RepID=UPI002FDEA6B8